MTKRKISNPLALAVLVLLYERTMHPYEMASTLRERHKEESIKLNYGSLYTVIELLERAGFILAKKTARVGKRPERTNYEISKSGEREMKTWLRELISTPVKEFPQFEAGLSLLPALEPDEVSSLFETRLQLLKHDLSSIRRGLRESEALKLPHLFSIESEYRLALLEAENRYVQALKLRIEKDGCGYIKEWRRWHDDKNSKQKKESH